MERVIVACEMISPELADYLLSMNIYDRELMILEHKINKIFNKLEVQDGQTIRRDLPEL